MKETSEVEQTPPHTTEAQRIAAGLNILVPGLAAAARTANAQLGTGLVGYALTAYVATMRYHLPELLAYALALGVAAIASKLGTILDAAVDHFKARYFPRTGAAPARELPGNSDNSSL